MKATKADYTMTTTGVERDQTTAVGEDIEMDPKKDVGVSMIEDVSPASLQSQFDTLRDLDEEQMAGLQKRLVRKLDWRMMPTITVMFLLKYAIRALHSHQYPTRRLTPVAAILIESMSPMHDWRAFRKTVTCRTPSGIPESQPSTSDTSSASFPGT